MHQPPDAVPTVEELYDEQLQKIGVTVRQGMFAWTFLKHYLGPRPGQGSNVFDRKPIGNGDEKQGS